MTLIYALDLAGTLVFAISGMATAAEKKFDLFGGAFIALVTAVGGGTLRDLLIGSQPVGWMQDSNYLIAVGLAVLLVFFLREPILRLRRTLFLFDSIGLGLFTVLGLEKTLAAGLSPAVAVLMGMVSAVFGGILRDLICNEEPLILRKEIYATACLAGGLLYFGFKALPLPSPACVWLTVGFVIVIRVLAVRLHWSLPVVR
ncbi:MAG: trimeric intracellular cation channel family protein [Bacteroidia bacterium]|nr:trimeric intracellular cation channel family protein [Bacteroidia bacterium]